MCNILGEISKRDIERSIYKNDLFDPNSNRLLDVASERFNKKSFSELITESQSKLAGSEIGEVIDLFNNIFVYDPTKRLSAHEILGHKWLIN